MAAINTPEVLGAGECSEVFIFPLTTNTGDVRWGTVATNGTQHGTLPAIITAAPGKTINLALIYIDVTVAGEGVRFIANS